MQLWVPNRRMEHDRYGRRGCVSPCDRERLEEWWPPDPRRASCANRWADKAQDCVASICRWQSPRVHVTARKRKE
jgi:hypothetical protein